MDVGRCPINDPFWNADRGGEGLSAVGGEFRKAVGPDILRMLQISKVLWGGGGRGLYGPADNLLHRPAEC